MSTGVIVMAGATGNLGHRVTSALLRRGASVRALVRSGTTAEAVAALRKQSARIVEVDFNDHEVLTRACSGASCVVSTLAGLRDVIVNAQTHLLNAAVSAGVPRFIPSDYSIDFTRLAPGTNRNLDLRREFHQRLDKAAVAATTIFNGAFTDMLTGPAPIVLFKFKRVLYWEDADQVLDFTTIDDTAAFTAEAALDVSTPRFLRIAGDQISARGLTAAVSRVMGQHFRLFRAGGLGRLAFMIKLMRGLAPRSDALYPPWQGMQYLHNMFSGRARLEPLDNNRYPGMQWTSAEEILTARVASKQ